jgi:hypothetical protein
MKAPMKPIANRIGRVSTLSQRTQDRRAPRGEAVAFSRQVGERRALSGKLFGVRERRSRQPRWKRFCGHCGSRESPVYSLSLKRQMCDRRNFVVIQLAGDDDGHSMGVNISWLRVQWAWFCNCNTI